MYLLISFKIYMYQVCFVININYSIRDIRIKKYNERVEQ